MMKKLLKINNASMIDINCPYKQVIITDIYQNSIISDSVRPVRTQTTRQRFAIKAWIFGHEKLLGQKFQNSFLGDGVKLFEFFPRLISELQSPNLRHLNHLCLCLDPSLHPLESAKPVCHFSFVFHMHRRSYKHPHTHLNSSKWLPLRKSFLDGVCYGLTPRDDDQGLRGDGLLALFFSFFGKGLSFNPKLFYMFVKFIVRWCIVLCAFQISPTHADIGSDLVTFFQRAAHGAGIATNTTSPGAYKDQTAGYYTGGSLVSRNPVRQAQIATLQLPGFRAGCGGIDLWMGGFSHISSGQLVEMLRNIGSNAASYAFMLAVQTVSPQVYNILNELNALATKINQTNINSCEAAATLLGGVWPKTDQSSKHLCQAMGTNLGAFSDWSSARQGCGAKGERDRVLQRKGTDPRYKDMLVGEFNLSWKAIQSNAFLSSDRELAELFMTLVGSIIVRKAGDDFEAITLPGQADREDVLTGLLNGGETPVYSCDNEFCLYPRLKKINLSEHQALFTRTHLVLESLIDKIYTDTEPTPEEKDFLNSTRLPVYKMLNVTTAYRKGMAPVDSHQYAELIALDILYKYVLEVIDLVHDSVTQLRSVQVDEMHLDRFLSTLRVARDRITKRRQSAYQQMDSTLSFIQATQLIEKQLHTMLGSIANETNWM